MPENRIRKACLHKISILPRASACALGTLLALAPGLAPRPAVAAGDELVLAVQPVLNEEQTRTAFQPLCDYLAQATGRPCRLFISPNFYA